MLCDGWNWPSGSGEEYENVKSLRQRRHVWNDNDGQLEKLTWAFDSGELQEFLQNKSDLAIFFHMRGKRSNRLRYRRS